MGTKLLFLLKTKLCISAVIRYQAADDNLREMICGEEQQKIYHAKQVMRFKKMLVTCAHLGVYLQGVNFFLMCTYAGLQRTLKPELPPKYDDIF